MSLVTLHNCNISVPFTFSAITGYEVSVLLPEHCSEAARYRLKQKATRHIIFTAETHNFPTGKLIALIPLLIVC